MKPAIMPITHLILAFSLLFLSSAPLSGQTIRGRVLVFGDTVGVDGATVTLVDQGENPLVQVTTDEAGFFQMPVDGPRRYGLRLSRIGFSSYLTEIVVGERELVEVELRMSEEAIPLDPLIITARREIRPGSLDEFHDRMERNRQRGVGNFITKQDVQNSRTASTTLLLAQVPTLFLEPVGHSGYGIRMRSTADYCAPDYYLDGLLTSWDRLPPMEDIEGVEIYRGRFEAPAGYWPSDCGVVFMWRSPDWGEPFSWSKLILATGLVAVAWGLTLIF